MNKIVLAHFALFSANLIYAVNYIVAKDVMPTFLTPSSFVLMRVIGGFVFFSPRDCLITIRVARGRQPPTKFMCFFLAPDAFEPCFLRL